MTKTIIVETIETLEALTEVPSLKDDELDVIGELISNMYGSLEVHKMIKSGIPQKDALKGLYETGVGFYRYLELLILH